MLHVQVQPSQDHSDTVSKGERYRVVKIMAYSVTLLPRDTTATGMTTGPAFLLQGEVTIVFLGNVGVSTLLTAGGTRAPEPELNVHGHCAGARPSPSLHRCAPPRETGH